MNIHLPPPPILGLTPSRMRTILIILSVALLVAYLLPSVLVTVGPGKMGVKWARFQGGTQMEHIYGEGMTVLFPWDKLAIYDMRLQEMHDRLEVLTPDGLKVDMDVTARFQPRAADLPLLHKFAGPKYQSLVVWPDIAAAVRRVVRQYRAVDLRLMGENDLPALVTQAARQAVGEHWVDVDQVLITRITLPPSLNTAIEDKLTQEQKALSYEHLIRQSELEAQRRHIEAQSIRDFEKTAQIPYLKWRGLEVTGQLTTSPNSKVILMGDGQDRLPLIMGDK